MEELLDSVLNATWKAPHGKGYYGEIAQAVDNVVLYDLMAILRTNMRPSKSAP